jgi:hypothetical protein
MKFSDKLKTILDNQERTGMGSLKTLLLIGIPVLVLFSWFIWDRQTGCGKTGPPRPGTSWN